MRDFQSPPVHPASATPSLRLLSPSGSTNPIGIIARNPYPIDFMLNPSSLATTACESSCTTTVIATPAIQYSTGISETPAWNWFCETAPGNTREGPF